MNIRKYTTNDLESMIAIWNKVVEDGMKDGHYENICPYYIEL